MNKSIEKRVNAIIELIDKYVPEGEKGEAKSNMDDIASSIQYLEKRNERLASKLDTLTEAFKALIDNI